VAAKAPLDRLPIFVRAGSIIPMTEPIQYVDQKPINQIFLDVYPGKKTTGHLYEDDGSSFDYERGAYSLTRFAWTGGRLKIDKEKSGCESAVKRYRVLVKRQHHR
jgi:alpha-D-xyloside xylohydrolase